MSYADGGPCSRLPTERGPVSQSTEMRRVTRKSPGELFTAGKGSRKAQGLASPFSGLERSQPPIAARPQERSPRSQVCADHSSAECSTSDGRAWQTIQDGKREAQGRGGECVKSPPLGNTWEWCWENPAPIHQGAPVHCCCTVGPKSFRNKHVAVISSQLCV